MNYAASCDVYELINKQFVIQCTNIDSANISKQQWKKNDVKFSLFFSRLY